MLAHGRCEAVYEQVDLAEVALDAFDHLGFHLIGERIAVERFRIQSLGVCARFERAIVVPAGRCGAIAFRRFLERDAERRGAGAERIDDSRCQPVTARCTDHQRPPRTVRECAPRLYDGDLLVDVRGAAFRMRSRADEASNAGFDDHRHLLQWLTDPVKNGGGAITDFGCYGANLMTWLMNGQAPVAVTAVTHHIKPDIYPKVDDDATIVLDYPNATGIIEASWNWPFSIKDWEVFGKTGYLHALNPNTLQQRLKNSYEPVTLQQPLYTDNLQYLSDVLHGKVQPENDLSSLENNIIVVRILEAAKRSAKEGKRVPL